MWHRPRRTTRGKVTTSSHTELTTSFADFPLRSDIVAALASAGIVSPFPIQSLTLPVALSGHDIIGQAKTGTGKPLVLGSLSSTALSPPERKASTNSPPRANHKLLSSSLPANLPYKWQKTWSWRHPPDPFGSSNSMAGAHTNRRSRRLTGVLRSLLEHQAA